MRHHFAILLFIALYNNSYSEELTKLVDVFIGTGGHGHTFPGAALPFGMIQLSPDADHGGWDWCSGYHYGPGIKRGICLTKLISEKRYDQNEISGFSHTHLSGTGASDLQDISLLPTVDIKLGVKKYFNKFHHENEEAYPGYYRVKFDNNIIAELTTSLRVGFHRYTFPENTIPQIVLNLKAYQDKTKHTSIYIGKDGIITGKRTSKGWAKHTVFFAMKFDKQYKNIHKSGNDRRIFYFNPEKEINVEVALSFTSIEDAKRHLKEAEGLDFEKTRNDAVATWETELSKIQFVSKNENTRKIFYTALYHCYIHPSLYSNSGEADMYTVMSQWDVYRALNPLLTIVQPERVTGFMNSYLGFFKKNGLLPVWELMGYETNCMTGYHSVPIVADAILKDIKGFDVPLAYEAMKKTSMQNSRGVALIKKYGYMPYNKHKEGATYTLEYAYDDWCIAQIANKLGKKEDEEYYLRRAGNYKNIYDTSSGFFRPRNSHGNFIRKFNPLSINYLQPRFTEGNAWQYNWYVPHDINGLMNLMGGKTKFVQKLDSIWKLPEKAFSRIPAPDVTGLLGQYAQGNEPCQHIPYIYSKIGMPEKTAEKTRKILKMYTAEHDGLPGNDDCGQMSAWYIFSALGFYPMNPCGGEYLFGSPLMDNAVINLPNGKKFEIVVNDNSDEKIYIKSAILNGIEIPIRGITHADIMNGGSLILNMGN